MKLEDKHFLARKEYTDKCTYPLMILMEKYKHWKIERFPTLEEDKDGVDLWISYPHLPDKIYPIQFKVRYGGRKDFIVSRYQPCWGFDQPIISKYDPKLGSNQTVLGRDWRSVFNKKSIAYYIATTNKNNQFTEISFVTSKKLCEKLQKLENEWEATGYKTKYDKERIEKMSNRKSMSIFTNDDGDQVFFQKNYKESPKFLMFINSDVRQGVMPINAKMRNELKQLQSKLELNSKMN